MDDPWLLLVEDDLIFSALLSRCWKAAYPAVPLVVVRSLGEMRQRLDGAASPPMLIVMDRLLPDGNGHQAALQLALPVHCWSAVDDGELSGKPQGKAALERSVRELASLAGLSS